MIKVRKVVVIGDKKVLKSLWGVTYSFIIKIEIKVFAILVILKKRFFRDFKVHFRIIWIVAQNFILVREDVQKKIGRFCMKKTVERIIRIEVIKEDSIKDKKVVLEKENSVVNNIEEDVKNVAEDTELI